MGILRFFLASAVLLTHAQASFQPLGGALAVSAFYVISGFYMQLLFAEKFTSGQVLPFYKSRALRIFPLYYVFLIVSIPFASDVLKQTIAQGDPWMIAFIVLELKPGKSCSSGSVVWRRMDPTSVRICGATACVSETDVVLAHVRSL